ncbi:chemerin-like receptor 2 [Lissotriton helveticus]
MASNISTPFSMLTTPANDDPAPIKEMHIAACIGNLIIFIVGIAGNGIVIWLGGFKMEKTVCTIWYLNLAVADFFFCATRILTAIREAMNFHWPFGNYACKVTSFIKFFNLFASVLLLMAISIDRCIMVTNPIWCRIHRTHKRSAIICFVVWLLATAMSVPYALYFETYGNRSSIICNYRKDLGIGKEHVLRMIRFIVSFVIPVIIISVCNIILSNHLKQRKVKTSKGALKLVIVVVVVFFVCWLPHHVLLLLKAEYGSRTAWRAGFKLANFLAFFTACINPFLYFFMGHLKNHRHKESLISVLSRVFAEDISSLTDSENHPMSVQTVP